MRIEDLISKARRDRDALLDKRAAALRRAEAINNRIKDENRSPTDAEAEQVRSAITEARELREHTIPDAEKAVREAEAIKAEEDALDANSLRTKPTAGSPHSGDSTHAPGDSTMLFGAPAADVSVWRDANGKPAALRRDQRFADHDAVREYASRRADQDRTVAGTHGNFAQMVRALTTSGASAIVPTDWSSTIIDKARNATAVMQAGATVVPMTAKTMQIGRITQDPTAAFRAEGNPVSATDPGYDYVDLVATSLSALTVVSVEFLQDAIDAPGVIEDAVAKQMALQIDLVALFGQLGATGTNDEGASFALASPNPKGLLKELVDYNGGSQIVGSFPTNGTAQTAATPWNEMLALIYKVKRSNEQANAILSNDALVEQYDGMYDTTYQPLRKPEVLAKVPWLTTNMIPSFTRGTMTSRATDVFAGDFSQLLIGQRLGLELRVLTERYAENGQVGILAYWRGDIAVARPTAFAAYRALQGAA